MNIQTTFTHNATQWLNQDINNNKRSKKQGGFIMKPVRFLTMVAIFLLSTSMVFAITESGTVITNQASGTYNDVNGNAMTGVNSNAVTTTISEVGGVTLTTGFNQNVDAFNSVSYPITLTNTGNADDTYTLDYSSVLSGTSALTDSLFLDNGSTPGAWDTGDTYIATGGSAAVTFAAGTADLILKVTDDNATGAIDADNVTVTLTATSTNTGTPSDQEVYITTALAAALTVTQTPTTSPWAAGDPVTYDVCLTNDGSLSAFNPSYSLPLNATYFVLGSDISVSVSYNGGGSSTLTAENSGTDTNADGAVISGGNLVITFNDVPAGQNVCFSYTLTLEAGLVAPITVPSEPVVGFEDTGGNTYPTPGNDSGGGEVSIGQEYSVTITENTNTTGPFTTPIDTVFYGFSLNNSGNGVDDFVLSGSGDSLTYEFYVDTDGDGVLDAAELTAGPLTSDTYTPDDTPVWIIATIIVPGTASDEDAHTVTITATSVGDGSATDILTLTITVAVPDLQIIKAVNTATAAPGDTLTYTVDVYNHGSGVASSIIVDDVIPTNTSYVTSSMTYAENGGSASSLVDVGGSDEGEYDSGTPKVSFTVTSLAADPDGGGVLTSYVTYTFKVTID